MVVVTRGGFTSPFSCRLISLSEFRTFESLLCAPDAVSQLAFRLFDLDNKGHISFGESMCVRVRVCVCVWGGGAPNAVSKLAI